ncbi:cysteine desulfurase family protein [Tissierella creatinophila]|uniref:Cysteine desulfurase IscS n=1 Tax=Tissierella creatinophila DSM 6911 TaxID=1123403 RepID=A0A1U7M6M8_TISCR|nr:cysteine desulfurase family protein [Tissierella creatinophila]OLS02941.1 cysteine desulfurase IscS [Tissierella creatinophila DSM 6911]
MIYLDNCATTKMRRKVIETMYSSLEKDFGNPSSLHRLGLKSEKEIKKSRQIVSDYLNVDEREIYFTSGGTESNNIAIQSIVNSLCKRGKHIITTNIEHASIINTMKELETKGFKVTYLDVDSEGRISLEDLKQAINDETILVSIIHVNNEIGTIQDIKEIKNIIKLKNSKVILHVDGIQSFGKIDFSIKDLGIDTFSFSSHKIHGPKGVGGLYVKRDLKLSPIVFGGNQERGMRSGTENVSGIIAFGKAVEIMDKNKQEERKHVLELKRYTIELIEKNIEDIKINSSLDNGFSPYILSISFRNTRGEVLLHFLEQKDIYISTASACSSNGTKKSDILKAIGLDDLEIEGTIRICFSYENNKDDIVYFVDELRKSVEEIRKIMKR